MSENHENTFPTPGPVLPVVTEAIVAGVAGEVQGSDRYFTEGAEILSQEQPFLAFLVDGYVEGRATTPQEKNLAFQTGVLVYRLLRTQGEVDMLQNRE